MTKRKKNILIYLSVIIFSVAAIVGICCAFLIKPQEEFLNISCEDNLVVEINDDYTLPVECSDENAVITLESANTEIVEVDGLNIIPKKEGKTTIRITASVSGKTTTKTIEVSVRKTITDLGLTLEDEITLYKLDKQINKANEDGYYNFISYTSTTPLIYSIINESIVEIKNGKIYAKEVGSTNINFFAKGNTNIHKTINVTVRSIPPTLTISNENSLNLKVNKTLDISYSITPVYYTGEASVLITIGDETIASVNNKTITALQVGTTNIKIYLNGNLTKTLNLSVTSDQNAIVTPPEDNNNENNNDENNDQNNQDENQNNNQEQQNDNGENQNGENNENNNDSGQNSEIIVNDYHFVLTPFANIEINETTITLLDRDACFKIDIYDRDNQKVTIQNAIQFSGMNVTLIMNGYYAFNDFESGNLTIGYPELDLEVNFTVIADQTN